MSISLATATLALGLITAAPTPPVAETASEPPSETADAQAEAQAPVTLERGDRGPEVKAMQQALADKGFPPGPIDGIFGRKTQAAVSAAQTATGLTVTGVFDQATATALDAYQPSDPPPPAEPDPEPTDDPDPDLLSIRQAQQRLTDIGFDPGPVDGIYGPKTRAGLEAFQHHVGITVTGRVDAETSSALTDFIGVASTGVTTPGNDTGSSEQSEQSEQSDKDEDDEEAEREWIEGYQQELADGPFDPGPVDGIHGTMTTQAIWALEKLTGITRDGQWGEDDAAALDQVLAGSVGGPQTSHDQRWVEVDLSQQLMMVYDPGQTVPVLVSHISSGSEIPWSNGRYSGESITPTGSFTILRRISGWRTSSLGIGSLYNPLYFTNSGIAFHGSRSVPDHPASHGCVRVPMHIAEYLPSWLPNDTPVEVRE